MNISSKFFGKTKDKQNVNLFTLKNKNGMSVSITNYGGIIQALTAPDRNGKYEDVVLGYDDLESYIEATPYFGAIVGRYANRIAKGMFVLDDVEYKLATNNGENHLHGGEVGFDKVVWDAATYQNQIEVVLELNYLSKDGEEQFPGNLLVTIKYILTNNDELIIEYEATTDKPTHVCLTNHSYFNLTSDFNQDVLNHELWLNSKTFLPINDKAIPFDELSSVTGTPFDFTKSTKIGARINEQNEQLQNGNGYDHCMIFDNYNKSLQLQGSVYEPESGRLMEVLTTEPATQLYTSNFLDGSLKGKDGIKYNKRTGLCLETEHYPDSPNRKDFPSTVLRPGETYSTKTVYKFSAK
ncbi:MAG: aldose epimerase family protein [Melioribacteraceae bacterium]